MNFGKHQLFNVAVSVIGLYGAVTSAQSIKRDMAIKRKRCIRSDRWRIHNLVHAEESQVMFDDYFDRIKYAAHYVQNFKDDVHIAHDMPREIYHSQMAVLDNEELATLLAAGLTSIQFPLEYDALFGKQPLLFKPRQFRYVQPEEVRADAADQFDITVTAQMLKDTVKYINSTPADKAKAYPLVVKFLGDQTKIILGELLWAEKMKASVAA